MSNWKSIPPCQWLTTEQQIIECVKYLSQSEESCFDSETTGLDMIRDYPLLFSLSNGIERFGAEADVLQHSVMKNYLETLPRIIGSNILIDTHWAENVGLFIKADLINTVTMDWLYDENREGRHGLKDCALDYCGIKMRDFKEVFPMNRATKLKAADTAKDAILRKISTPEGFEDAKQYAGLDAYANMHVYWYLKEKLQSIDCYPPTYNSDGTVNRWTLWDYYLAIEVPFARVLYNLERRGIALSTGYLKQLEVVAKKKIDSIEAEFMKMTGENINLRSPAQLKKFFFGKLGKPLIERKKGNPDSVDEKAIKIWVNQGDKFAAKLQEHRKISKLYSTYIKGLQEDVSPDGRIRSTLRGHTVSGRLNSNGPNLQNIPVGENDIFGIRRAFIAPVGRVLLDADFSQLELVILAHRSGDEKMIEAIEAGKDLHIFAVSRIYAYDYDYCKSIKDKADSVGYPNLPFNERQIIDKRSSIKKVWYGCAYGIGCDKLGEDLTNDFRDADPTAKSKQCPYCLTVYPIDWESDTCHHIAGLPIINKWVDKRKFTNKRKIKLFIDELRERYGVVRNEHTEQLIEVSRIVSPVEAQEYIDLLLNEFIKVKLYLENQIETAHREKRVQSLLGRYRNLGSIDSVNYKDMLEAERQSKNSIQNDAADIMRIVMLAIEEDQRLKELDVIMLLQIHDELLFEAPDDEAVIEEAKGIIKYHMENAFNERAFKLKVKLKAKPQVGIDWASIH
mgnify:FL=1